MTSNAINSVLYNVDQTADTTSAEKAQARANIGAQGALTAGPNIDIYADTISTEKPRVEAGTNVSVNGVLDPQTRTVTYTVSATDTTYNVFNTTTDGLVPKASGTGDTGKFLKGDGTWEAVNTTVNASAPLYGNGTQADPVRLLVSHGLSLVQPAGGNTALQVTHPVPAPGSTSTGKVLTCTDALGNLSWQTPPSGHTYQAGTGLSLNSNTFNVDNPLPAPTFNMENYKYLRAEDSEMVGEPPTITWVDPFTIAKYRSQSNTWLQESVDTIAFQDTQQGDWGIQVTGYDASSMPNRRYLVPAMSANAFLRTDANGKMEWESIPDLDVEHLTADGIEYYNLNSGDNYISLPWHDSRATILQLQSDSSVDIYLETDETTTVHSMLILANAGQGGVYYCAHVVVHYNDELGNARTWDIPFGTANQAVIIDAFMKKVGSGLSATSIGRVTVRKQDEAVQF